MALCSGNRFPMGGAEMADMITFKGRAKRLDDIDLPKLGRLIGVGEDVIHAVIDTETAGSGFDSQGRPKVLPEPHIFWRELGEKKRQIAENQGIAYPRWGMKPYAKDAYARLNQMIVIDRPAALRSASWGLGQIMGFNHKLAGYSSAEAMIEAILDDEEAHLKAMVGFIKSAGIDDDLRYLDGLKRRVEPRDTWGFVSVYNGAGFRKNAYDVKFAASLNRWRGIRDTPFNECDV